MGRDGEGAPTRARFSERAEAISERDGGGWETHFLGARKRAAGEDVILLSVGDHDFPTDPEIVETAVTSLREQRQGYLDVAGKMAMRAAVAEAVTADRAVPVATEEVIVTLGAQGALYSVLQCLLDPGDEVVACDPFYVTYLETARAAGAALVAAPLDVARGFAVDVDAIAARITPRTRALLLNTPNNPTGATIDAAAWAAIAELAEAHDLWIVSDEVYGGLVFDGRHVSALDLARARPQLRDRIAIIDSLSKSHAMTGWRIGWTIGPADLIARIDALGVCLHYGLPGFVQDAAITAIAARGRVTPSIRETYRSRRELLCEALSGARGLRARPPSAGMFVMLDVRDTGLSSRDFAMRLLEEAGVTLMPGESFGAAARGFLRVSLAADEGALKEAAARIRRFADTL